MALTNLDRGVALLPKIVLIALGGNEEEPAEYLHLPVKVDLPAAAGTAERRISLPQAAS